MKEINEYTGNIKLQWNGETETCLHELFLSSGTSHAITRELGENDNQHYHFYLSGCTILVKSLRDKILKLLPQLKQPHLKDKTNKDGTKKGWERNLMVHNVQATNKKTYHYFSHEDQVRKQICYVYKDISPDTWKPILNNITQEEAINMKHEFMDLREKETIGFNKIKSQKVVKENHKIENIIKALKDKNTSIGVDGNSHTTHITQKQIIEMVIDHYIQEKRSMNKNIIQNTVETICCILNPDYKSEYINIIKQRISENNISF